MAMASRPGMHTVTVLITSGVAWIVMILQHTDWSSLLPEGLRVSHGGSWWSLSWMLAWFVMVLAMMLPPALPFLKAVQALVDGRRRALLLYLQAASTFVALWMVVGVLLALISLLLSEMLMHWPWAVANPGRLAGLAAILAAAYQFSPLKRTCLTACRSPTALMLVHWHPARPVASLQQIALRYALVCIGCCWPLMALTLLVGSVLLPVMVVVSVLMLAERLLPSSRPLVPLQAAAAFGLGVLLLSDPGQQSLQHLHVHPPVHPLSHGQHLHQNPTTP